MPGTSSALLGGLLADAAPPASTQEAEALARRYFGVTGAARPLPGERDRNFRLTDAEGRAFVLKVTHPAEDPAVTDLQSCALQHLAARDPSLPVPVVRLPLRGEAADVPWAVPGIPERRVRMYTYLSGRPLPEATPSPAQRRDLGAVLGRIDVALRDFEHPADGRELLWDCQHAGRVRELLAHLPEPALAARALDRFERFAVPRLAGLRTQVIHNDLNPQNVLVDPEDEDRVAGIIDFGDMVRAPLVQDLAVAAAYALGADADPLRGPAELAAAFHAVCPLEPDELEVLPDLIAARLVLVVAIGGWRAAQQPENRDYILRNNAYAWAGLRALDAVPRADAQARLRAAAGMATSMRGLLARRERLLGPAYRLFYRDPVHVVRGEGVWLYDPDGNAYLDAYNNVACVGHCHPHVVEALARQAATLNTHTRYLAGGILDYAERLLERFPPALGHVMFTCTGSEANDLAYRAACAATGGTGVIVTQHAYHGVTAATAALSPSLGPHAPLGAHVRTVPAPDAYRSGGRDVGEAFAAAVRAAIDDLRAHGIAPAALLVDTIFSSDGIHADPAGFLAPAVEAIRAAGGLLVADEVQAGFGRTGEGLWGFARHGVVPDVVTLGKPMGNGHPVAGIVARPEIVEAFAARTRYFNTFGGNPVSCAVGMAVLDVLDGESLPQRARDVGGQLADGLRALAARHGPIGDVRGAGLFIGVELVADRDSRAPAGDVAARVVEGLRDRRILISSCGREGNVLKIRPPLVFGRDHADLLLAALDDVLGEERPGPT